MGLLEYSNLWLSIQKDSTQYPGFEDFKENKNGKCIEDSEKFNYDSYMEKNTNKK